jgi:hypothetical protein
MKEVKMSKALKFIEVKSPYTIFLENIFTAYLIDHLRMKYDNKNEHMVKRACKWGYITGITLCESMAKYHSFSTMGKYK